MPLCENITSSTKSEVHNVSQHGKKGPSHGHAQTTDTENLVKFGLVVFEVCSGQTDTLTTIFRPPGNRGGTFSKNITHIMSNCGAYRLTQHHVV